VKSLQQGQRSVPVVVLSHLHTNGGKHAVAVAVEELVPGGSHAVIRRERRIVVVSKHQLQRPSNDPQAGNNAHDLNAVVVCATRHRIVVHNGQRVALLWKMHIDRPLVIRAANEIDQGDFEIVPIPFNLCVHLKLLDLAGAVDVVGDSVAPSVRVSGDEIPLVSNDRRDVDVEREVNNGDVSGVVRDVAVSIL